MFLVLDTNHYTELIEDSRLGQNLTERLRLKDADVFISVITAQEVMQGWLAEINRRRAGADQLRPYKQFQHNLEALGRITILPFDPQAAGIFAELLRQRLGIGNMDLKIASICLAHDTLLLTRNRVDFDKVPGLRVENWLD